MTPWNPTITSDELYHHGILGMKWGVRRYQNYDGTYTAAGLQHYKKAEGAYDKANAKYKETKKAYKSGTVSKGELKRAKIERKYAKKVMSKEYDQLKQDKLADKGKERYASGKTITGNSAILNTAVSALGTGAAAAGYASYMGIGKSVSTKYGNIPVASLAAIGLGAASSGLAIGGAVYNEHQAKKLRAYYGHSRPQFEKSLSKYSTQKNIELQKTKKYDNEYKNGHKQTSGSSQSKIMNEEANKLMKSSKELSKAFGGKAENIDDPEYFEQVARELNLNTDAYWDAYKNKKKR